MVTRFILISLGLFIISACSGPKPVTSTEQYHPPEPVNSTPSRTLNGLQLKGFEYMNQGNYQQAILYFQRAVKIDPRNPQNWHYLAQNYLHLGDFNTCQAMIRRSMSYAQFDNDLKRANKTLMEQCSR